MSAGARLAAPLLALASCGGAGDGPSALLVTLDTTRADALGCYGGPDVTPVLDRLAEDSVRYARAYATAPLTMPSHASMLTGLVPPRHTVRDNGLAPLPREAETLAERAAAAGVDTAAFVAAVVLDRNFGLDQGFEHWFQPEVAALEASSHATELPASVVVAHAERWLRAREVGRPFFAWVHLFDPHGPYEPPERFRGGAFDGAGGYHGEVAAADHAIGRLVGVLAERGELGHTTVLVVADHGESLGEHGETSHGAFLWETTMRVPLLVRFPDGYRAGETSDELVSVVDVFPTLGAALGLEPRAAAAPGDGYDLRAGVPAGRGVYLESYQGYLAFSWSPLVAWRDEAGKSMWGGEPRFFDVDADPDEARDLAAERADVLERHRAALRELVARPGLEPEQRGASPERLDDLRALGYASVGGERGALPAPLEPTGLPDPLERAAEHADALRAMELNNVGRYEEAEAILLRLLEGNPDHWFALDRLAFGLVQRGEHARAATALERLVERGPAWSHSALNLGFSLLELGREAEAIEALRRAVELDPARARDLEAKLADLRRRGQGERAGRVANALSSALR